MPKASDLVSPDSMEASIKPGKEEGKLLVLAPQICSGQPTALLVSTADHSHLLSLRRDSEEDRPRPIQNGGEKWGSQTLRTEKLSDTVSPMKAKVELTFPPVRTTDGRGLPRPAPGWAGQGPLHFFIVRKTFPWSRAIGR